LISVPILLIVISLLISADQIFKSYMDRIPNIFANIRLEEYFARGFLIIFIFFTSFSYIYSLYIKKKPEVTGFGDGTIKLPKIWDPVVVTTILILINVIYLLFVLVQFTYLFGGASFDLPQDFTYSEYARRGFFELIAVTIINLSILMLFLGFTKMKSGASARFIRVLYSFLVGCTIVMLISAYYRMLLYEEAYGFTYLRVLTQAFMIFLLVIFSILLLRIWIDRLSLAKPFIITAVIAFVVINYINIDVVIAKNNIERYNATNKIDVEYLSTLSYDAIPEIAKLTKAGDEKIAADVTAMLKGKKEAAARYKEWQSFNLSRYRAEQYLK
jgi:Predicted signaling protein consisting of a modified GGDEF domain and a DHH domain